MATAGTEFSEDDKQKLEKVFIDMYLGVDKDNPSVTMRLDRVERLLGVISKLLIGVLAAVGADVLSRLLRHI